jgi:phytoene/squalene synthetase
MADVLVPAPRQFADRHRAEILALAEFHDRARAIADNTDASPELRIAQLKRLSSGEPGSRLVQAFQKDVSVKRFRNWSELIAYCRFAGAPIGRFLIELHGEDPAHVRAAETLYSAKLVLRKLQSCKADHLTHDRVYLPADWMKRAGIDTSALAQDRSSPGLRQVFDQMLDGAEAMIEDARADLARLADRKFRIAMQTEIAFAKRLAASLRRSDILARPVELSRPAFLFCIVVGHTRGYWQP